MDSFVDLYVWPTAIILAGIVAIVAILLGAVAYLTYAERKVIAVGPMRSVLQNRQVIEAYLGSGSGE